MKNNKPAEAYAKPHDMQGHSVDGQPEFKEYSTDKTQKTASVSDPIPNGVSIGFTREVKTSGIEMRGFGAATKGKMSRGPMA